MRIPFLTIFVPISELNGVSTHLTRGFIPSFSFFVQYVFIFLLICLLVEIVLVAVLIFSVPKFVSSKIISGSLKIALNKKSHTWAFIRLVFSATIISGAVIGLICLSIANDFSYWWSESTNFVVGLLTGIVAGVITGVFTLHYIRKFTKTIGKKFSEKVFKISNRLRR